MKDLWNKPVNELTVKDSVNLQLQMTAVVVTIGIVLLGGAALTEKALAWKRNRKNEEKTEK